MRTAKPTQLHNPHKHIYVWNHANAHGLIRNKVGRVAKVTDPMPHLPRKTVPDHSLTKAFQRKPVKSALRHWLQPRQKYLHFAQPITTVP